MLEQPDYVALYAEAAFPIFGVPEDHQAGLNAVIEAARTQALLDAAEAYPTMLRDMVSRGNVYGWLLLRAEQEAHPNSFYCSSCITWFPSAGKTQATPSELFDELNEHLAELHD